MSRLAEIEDDLRTRQGPYELAAGARTRLQRDYDLRLARTKLQSKAETETAKKDRALDAIAAADDGLYEQLCEASASHEALRAAISVLEKRASIGQSLLRALTQEQNRSSVEPSWSRAA